MYHLSQVNEGRWNGVAETEHYIARASKLLTEEERDAVTLMLARNPTCGDVMKETGGLRKLRVGVQGRGKSGGARVVYYFYNGTMPLFLLEVYAKNEKEDLSAADRKRMIRLTTEIRRHYRRE